MKKGIAFFLACAMTVSLAACGSGAKTGDSVSVSSGTESTAATEGKSDNGELYEIVMEYPTLGTTPAGLQDVEDALNARVEKELGVHVTLYPVSAFELNTTTNLMVSSGEKLDLALSLFENGVSSYVNKGVLIPLDDLVDKYGKGIVEAEGMAMSGGYVNGSLYAIPSEEKMARVKGFMARKDLLDKYGIQYDPKHIYSMDELTDIFTKVKAGEGKDFYCIAINGKDEEMNVNFDPTDFLGTSLASGGLMNYGKDDKITNYYESDNYKKITSKMREWYNAGFLSPDCNTVTDADLTQLETGKYLGFFENCEPDMKLNQSAAMMDYVGTEVVPLYTSYPSAMTQFYNISQWAIPITCDNPEKTMQFLNLLFTDRDIINLMQFGVEGKHWNFKEGSKDEIAFANGYTQATSPYPPLLNVWGDKSKDYVMDPVDSSYYQMLKDFNGSVNEEHTSTALGYCFNSDSMKTQYAAIRDVISQYSASLSMGVVDPEKTLPEFLTALKSAGIDEVIKENQKQFDEWKAKK